jgi:radical SAM protein with 4Fe4S-binding SPASM domain
VGVSFVQVSIDGGRKAHDAIRGEGNYDRAVRGLEWLKEVGQPTMVSFTANRSNFMDFGKAVSLGRRVGAIKVWSDRMVPCGSGANMKDGTFTPEDTHQLVDNMRRIKRSDRLHPWSRTETAMDRSLQFLSGGRPYACTAGRSLLTVMPNGDVYPCRRLPIKVGNIKGSTLVAIYYGDGMLRRLRDPSIVARGCEDCHHHPVCKGGSRCLAYAVTGDPFRADPGCWISRPLPVGTHRAVAGGSPQIK